MANINSQDVNDALRILAEVYVQRQAGITNYNPLPHNYKSDDENTSTCPIFDQFNNEGDRSPSPGLKLHMHNSRSSKLSMSLVLGAARVPETLEELLKPTTANSRQKINGIKNWRRLAT